MPSHVCQRLTAWLSAGVVAVLILYPMLVYVGLSYLRAGWIAAALIAVCVFRLLGLRFGVTGGLATPQVLLVCSGGIALAAVSWLSDSHDAMLYYPALVNGGLLLVFGYSLVYPPTVVERIARLREHDLPERAVTYTRRVTIAWVVFFVCNGAVALYTALRTPLEIWAFYNGIVAYILIGAMFGGELLVRTRVMRKLRK